jgi:beta-glucosidase
MLDQRVREVLKLASRASKIGIPENAPEGARDVPETADFLRKLASESITLLKNTRNSLPFQKEKSVRVPAKKLIESQKLTISSRLLS